MSSRVVTCYFCQEEGHFAVNCPEKSMREKGSSNFNDEDIPERKCPCGAGNCVVLTSRTLKNPGRKFYKCPLYKSSGTKCNFFEWCDLSRPDQKHEVPQPSAPECPCGAGKCLRFPVKREGKNKGREFYVCPVIKGTKCNFFEWCDNPISEQKRERPLRSYPECSCGAGRCHRLTVKRDGENKGRKFFVCPVKKGQGACNFFQWGDENMEKDKDEDEDMVEAGNDGNDGQLGVTEAGTSFWSTLISQVKVKATNSFQVNDEDDSEYDEASSDEKQSEAPSSISGDVKEMVDVVDTDIDDAALPNAIHNLKLSEDKRAGTPTKPGSCFRCGKEGHWMKDCLRVTANLCSKCGKFGHTKKNCRG